MKSLSLGLALAAAAAGCAGTLAYPGTADYRKAQGYDARRPVDVAVLAPSGSLPEGAGEALREGLRDRLRALRYAPVRSRAVDEAPGDFRPGGANAVLEVIVTKWDMGAIWGDGTLRASAEVRLYGSGSTEVLYRAILTDVVVRASFVARNMDDRPRTIGQAAAELAERLLEQLPAKGDG